MKNITFIYSNNRGQTCEAAAIADNIAAALDALAPAERHALVTTQDAVIVRTVQLTGERQHVRR